MLSTQVIGSWASMKGNKSAIIAPPHISAPPTSPAKSKQAKLLRSRKEQEGKSERGFYFLQPHAPNFKAQFLPTQELRTTIFNLNSSKTEKRHVREGECGPSDLGCFRPKKNDGDSFFESGIDVPIRLPCCGCDQGSRSSNGRLRWRLGRRMKIWCIFFDPRASGASGCVSSGGRVQRCEWLW